MTYLRINLGELKSRLADRLGNNTTFWTNDEMVDAINEAIQVWQALTGQWVNSFTFIPQYTQHNFIDLPKQIVSPQRIQAPTIPLAVTALEELDNGFTDWQTVAGTPYLTAPVGMNKAVIYPPTVSGTLRIDGMTVAPRLFADGDFIDIGDEEVNKILSYAHGYLTFKEGPTESDTSDAMLQTYIEAAVLRNSRFKATAMYRKYMGENRETWERPMALPDREGGR